MDVTFEIFEKKKCKLMCLRVLYDQIEDIFFETIVTNDKWSWSIYFEFTLTSSRSQKTAVIHGVKIGWNSKRFVLKVAWIRSETLKKGGHVTWKEPIRFPDPEMLKTLYSAHACHFPDLNHLPYSRVWQSSTLLT